MKHTPLVPCRQGGCAFIFPAQAVIQASLALHLQAKQLQEPVDSLLRSPRCGQAIGSKLTLKQRRGAQKWGGGQGMDRPLQPLSKLPCSWGHL